MVFWIFNFGFWIGANDECINPKSEIQNPRIEPSLAPPSAAASPSISVGTVGSNGHVRVNQDADGFVPRGNLLVRRGSAVQFFARIELASKVLVDFLVAVSRGRLRNRPLR